MDFSRLPADAFLKIFEYLSLEDCIRARRVDKTFRRIAQLVISHTKSLDLAEKRFRNLTSDQLAVILDLCWSSLELIKFPSHNTVNLENLESAGHQGEQLAAVFSSYQCPRLIDIDLGSAPIDYPIFEQLIRNNPKMKSLAWRSDFVGFPDIMNNSLKKLDLRVTDNVALQSLIGRCPNLKELDLHVGNIDANVLDQFFASIPQVHHVKLSVIVFDIAMRDTEFENDLVNFWNLPLISLIISPASYCSVGDDFLQKVATSFPHLRKLHVEHIYSTNAGIAALGALHELEILKLRKFETGSLIYYDNVLGDQLAHCLKLQKLDVFAWYVSGGTLVNLLRSCPQLEHVIIREITEVDNSEEAAVILESLAGIPQRDITIEMYSWDPMVKSIWNAEPVKEVIGMLEENDGMKLKINVIRY